MGIVRWTAKGLKITGEILDSENVEKWLESQARKLLEDKAKQLPAKWFAGQVRARRWLRKEVAQAIDGSPAFRAALEESLAKLPELLLEIALKISSAKPPKIVADNSRYALVVCPRGLVRQLYCIRVVDSLKNAATLSRFTGLPEMFLARCAQLSEDSYFLDKKRLPTLEKRGAIADIDDDYPWKLFDENGHYYVGVTRYSSDALSDKKAKQNFDSFIENNLEPLKITIGALSVPEIEDSRGKIMALFP